MTKPQIKKLEKAAEDFKKAVAIDLMDNEDAVFVATLTKMIDNIKTMAIEYHE